MDALRIHGGRRLAGALDVAGSRHAALPVLCATLLADGAHCLRNVPRVGDVELAAAALRTLGVVVDGSSPVLRVDASRAAARPVPYDLVRRLRAAVLLLGPLLARHGEARVALPGGDPLGPRPIDQHLQGLAALGAEVAVEHGEVRVRARRLRGAEFTFRRSTVGGTQQLLLAAVLAAGRTTLHRAAREPEVEELARVLNKMGAEIAGAGTDTIHVTGVRELHAVDHALLPDRIEAGTWLVAGALTAGDVLVRGARLEALEAVAAKLRQVGAELTVEADGIRVRGPDVLRACDVTTQPHPGFPSDLQPALLALLCRASGESVVTETVFEQRFLHVPELVRLGADVQLRGASAVVRGVPALSGAPVTARDPRGAAALVLAGLAAEGETCVRGIGCLDRACEDVAAKLVRLGAAVERIELAD